MGQTFQIERQKLGYPSLYRDGSSALGAFIVPSRAANALIVESGFEVAEVAPGRAIFSLVCVHYTDSDCGVYEEISLGFFVKKLGPITGLPYLRTWRDIVRGEAPSFSWRLPVTSRLARDAGIFMWGFPKTIENIGFEVSNGRASFALRMDDTEVLRYSVPAKGKRSQPATSSPVYSVFEGAPHVSQLTQEFRDVGIWLGAGRLELGEHPFAEDLRTLGLPRRPLLSTWMGHLAFEMSAPEKL